jgi:holo-[acyl-carrier protein] synthase
MRLVGHGVDVQDMRRVELRLADPNNDWLDGAFTDAEQASADAPPKMVQYFAGRYAAKEAVAKALGTGFSEEVCWLDIEVRRKPTGAPEVHLTGGAAEVARSLGISAWLVSFSHSGDYAMASVIAVSDP